ncbi:MAG: aldo/keto reductase [Chloroflexi bacterium]|nr:aldo/keto reductase [Chloroflexota bacterium]
MRFARLGNTGLEVSRICLGTMTMGDQSDETASIRILDHALEHGITFFDTAEVYTDGRSEEYIGKAFKGKRDKVILATKARAPAGTPLWKVDLSRKHIIEAIDSSLRRLQTDYVDLYQVHRWEPWTPLEETMRALDDLVRQGKVRYIGCSNYAAWQLTKSLWISDKLGLERFVSIQPLYNVMLRYLESETLALCKDQGIAIIPYNPLAGGFLTGKYKRDQQASKDTRFGRRSFYMERYWNDGNFDKLARIEAMAAERGGTLVDYAIGWLLHRPEVPSVIVGATSTTQLDASIKAGDAVLTQDEWKALSAMWPPQGPPTVPGAIPPRKDD